VVAGDPTAARAAMLEHVEATRDWIVGLHLGRLDA
jgi:DNA-binding FadR family transcriptional regulator